LLFSLGSTYHGASQAYIFSPYTYTSVLDQKTSTALASYLNSFVATGNPNSFMSDEALLWKPYHGKEKEYNILHMKVGEHVIQTDPDHNARCDFMLEQATIISN
jgi:hypothetical protein